MNQQEKTKKEEIADKMKKLESIVAKFEKGDIGIEKGISEYQKAASLIKEIKKHLTRAELKIRKIKKSTIEE